MLENRMKWQDTLFKLEGGFSDRPLADDPGVWTKYGITRAALAARRGCDVEAISREDVQNLTLEQAKAIASANYWNPPRCTDMVGGVDVYCADFAFNSSPRQAVKTLQRVLGFRETKDKDNEVDGFSGPDTLAASAARDPRELIDSYHEARMAFLRKLPNWDANKNGWEARCEAMRDLAITLAPHTAPAAVATSDGHRRWVASVLSAAGVGATTMLPDLVAAIPQAKAAYQQTAGLLEPYSVYSSVITPIIGGLVILGILFVHLRGARMAANAKAAGTEAEVVAK
jgi:lysozyme family protein